MARCLSTTYDGEAWTRQAKIEFEGDPEEYTFAFFGEHVDVDGDTAVIASDLAAGGGRIGGAYAYVRNGDAWTQQIRFNVPTPSGTDLLGSDVAIDGNIAVIGAGQPPVRGDASEIDGEYGRAYIFERSGTTWSLAAELLPENVESETGSFGEAVAISGDTVVIGAPNNATDFPQTRGAVYVYTRGRDGTWSLQAKLNNPGGDNVVTAGMGKSVAIEGDVLVAGAWREDTNGVFHQGAAHIFRRNGATWSNAGRLAASDGEEGDNFGFAVDIAERVITVGADQEDAADQTDSGALYVFRPVGPFWFESS